MADVRESSPEDSSSDDRSEDEISEDDSSEGRDRNSVFSSGASLEPCSGLSTGRERLRVGARGETSSSLRLARAAWTLLEASRMSMAVASSSLESCRRRVAMKPEYHGSSGPLAMRYTPFFCEENAWHLARDRAALPGERCVLWVLGADPAHPAVAVWAQRAAAGRPFVVWDYHVVVCERPPGADGWEVWDPDSTLGMPLSAARWIEGSFPQLLQGFEPRFRLVEAAQYLASFSSDRRHMRAPDGGEVQPFPRWPPILDAEGRHLLPRFVDAADAFLGEICDREGLRARLAPPRGETP